MHLVNILINVGRDTDNAISVICNRSFCSQICTNTDKANFLIDFWLSLAWNEYIQVNYLIWGGEDFRRLFLPLWVSFGMLTKFASIFWKLNYVERPSRMEMRKIEGFFYCNNWYQSLRLWRGKYGYIFVLKFDQSSQWNKKEHVYGYLELAVIVVLISWCLYWF